MRLFIAGFASLAAIVCPALPSTAAAGPPTVNVSPDSHLAGGDTVHVTGTGITPAAPVQVIQCDIFDDNDSGDNCPTLTTTAADPTGGVSVDVTLGDPVYRSQDVGDAWPIYCRADHCQIFLVWPDANGVVQFVSSGDLQFSGAPAHIHAHPSRGLRNGQVIRANGSAYGAQGHKIRILEEACYRIVQGSGCYDQLPAVVMRVGSDGTFTTPYRVRRYLP